MTKAATALPEIPAELATDAFRRAWMEFCQHRREIRQALKPTGAAGALKKLAGWGEAKAIAAIQQSIENGWTGLFEPRGVQSRKSSSQLDKEQRADKLAAMERQRERERHAEEKKARIAKVATLSVERRDAARKYFANQQPNAVARAAMLKADPLGGGRLTDLIYAALVARESAA